MWFKAQKGELSILKKQRNRSVFSIAPQLTILLLLACLVALAPRIVSYFWSNTTSLSMTKQMFPVAQDERELLIPGNRLHCAGSPEQPAQVIEKWKSASTSDYSAIIVPYAWHCGTPELAQQTIDWINANRPTASTLADIWVRYYQGDVFYTQGKLDQAIEAWRGVPNSGWFFASIGSGLYDKDRAAALHYYEISERLDPGWKEYRVEFYWKQCLEFYNQKQYDAALTYCQAAVEFAPHAAYLQILGQVYAARQEYTLALKTFDRALQADTVTENIAGYAHRGKMLVYRELGQDAQAQTELRAAAQLLPDEPWVQIALGDFYIEQKDFAAAQTVFEHVLTLSDAQAKDIAADRLKQLSALHQ
jgi:tetratricopeptide (TPR) repeat protein